MECKNKNICWNWMDNTLIYVIKTHLMKSTLCLLFTCLLAVAASAQEMLTASELLDRSIAFHDPDGQWEHCRLTFVIDMQTPNRPVRTSKVMIDNDQGRFELSVIRGGHVLEWMVDSLDTAEVRLDYRQPTAAQADSLDLNPERARRWRDYYGYLYGLPMKLKDPGTNIAEGVINTTFQDKPVLALKVTYDEAVGSDTWYFYFNPNTYAMEGYRFYHDEAKNDGEYIVLTGMSIKNGMRIPKDRAWYVNADDRLLGTDYLINMDVKRIWKE
jgi:hypothetical protein